MNGSSNNRGIRKVARISGKPGRSAELREALNPTHQIESVTEDGMEHPRGGGSNPVGE